MLFMDFKIEKLIKNRISSSYNTIQKLIENCCLDISNGTDIIKTSLINNGKIFGVEMVVVLLSQHFQRN